MMLEGTNASSAIRWVRQDLDEALQSVRDNLEAFAANRSDRAPLKAVQESLEQLNLTFLTMAQRGASILTDEMIAVGGHMLHNGNANQDDSLAALTDAVIVLPSYLDRLQAGHDDLPILLLPTLNELRATYDESLLSEGTLFAPDLEVMIPELNGNAAIAVVTTDFAMFARRARNQYQSALLGWLKEQSKPELLVPLQEVCATLHARLGRASLRRLWWIAEMTIAGFREGAVDNDLPLRRLFARLDLTLKLMNEGGQDGPSEDAILALSRALLFQAAQAEPGSKPLEILRKRFKLEELIPDREALLRARGAVTGRDAELFRSIGEAVREEMSLVKDTLDMELRTGRVEKEKRDKSLSALRQLADTLMMLNLPVPARAVEELLPGLEAVDGQSTPELDSPLLKLARKLIEVESVLEAHIRLLGEPTEATTRSGYIELPEHEQRMIMSCVLDQCVVNLQDVQEAVRKRLGGDAEADFETPLDGIIGALKVAGQSEVSTLSSKLARTLNAGLSAKAAGASDEAARLIPLTDAVAALELYLTGCRDEQANSLRYLEIMHERLDGLPEASAKGEALEATQIELPSRETVAAPETIALVPSDTPEPALPAIDEEIQSVFLEEFDTVMGSLLDQLPAWLEDPSNARLQADMKRGFHTLKGSGRMVGATEIGDFAGRVEEVLNRVIDNRLAAEEPVISVVRLAVAALPELKARLLHESSSLDAASIAAFTSFNQELTRGNKPALKDLVDVMPERFLFRILASSADEPAEAALTPEATPAALQQTAEPVTFAQEVAPELHASSVEPTAVEVPVTAESGPDRELSQLMIIEIRQYTTDLDAFLSGHGDFVTGEPDQALVRSMHTLAGTMAMSPLGQEVEVARAVEHYFEALLRHDRSAGPDARQVLAICLHRFRQRLSILEDGVATTYPLEDQALLADLEALKKAASAKVAKGEAAKGKSSGLAEEAPAAGNQAWETSGAAPASADAAPAAITVADTSADTQMIQVEDSGVLHIFLEEANDVLARCDTILNNWRDKLGDQKLVQNLQREIHTFKGGARMAGLDALGDLSHAMETLLERIAANRLQATVAAVQALEEGCDRLTLWVEQLQAGRMPDAGDALARFEHKANALSVLPAGKLKADARLDAKPDKRADTASRPEGKEQLPAAQGSIPADELPAEAGIVTPPLPTAPSQVAASGQKLASTAIPRREFYEVPDAPVSESADEGSSQQHIRVGAELMDSLINYAGEISIYRARLEQQLGTVRFNLKEADQTVGRLKEQLRKMEMETEAQMLSRYQHASTRGSSEFDPLELDRFSNMQQLSRALGESVSDLLNLQGMLEDSVRQAESLLVQQSRVSTDLQEGLMQTRMTPFGTAAPRLRRVVRAAAAETGKKARLQLKMAGSSDQLDRNVLERITAPLEHMLRNAVVHGIELPKERRRREKPEEGEITVTVEAEATEFVVCVEDDGNGVDLEAVRRRAIERGMINKSEKVAESRLVSFILESGFSTATTVTGLAGRGVGMDVVNSEIKQIGGSMDIGSEPGRGTRFTIRIPFSLSVMQAIGVTVAQRPFLIPLNSVAGVARMLPADYAAMRAKSTPVYEFAGESYPVLELEPLLGEEPIKAQSGNVSLLMIRAGDHKAAFRVAELQGHQEVVVKPVGPQVSSIPGILGATISADGQVVIILDMGPVIRRGLAAAAEPEKPDLPAAPKEKRTPLVMVVDDSITMRKVTSRVLENHSLEVMTAQDGLDAIENLHDRVPDLMLLDIEMPRMDGYELAEHVRADPRLRHIPIVMITSRAGQKHRKKARDAGANAYLTKPYQEAELVAQVGEMLNMQLQQRRHD